MNDMSDMTGGSSTAAAAATVPGKVYHLGQPADVVALLRRVHQLPLSSEEKNSLRDAVFAVQSNPAPEIPSEIAELFAEQNLSVTIADGGDELVTPTTVSERADGVVSSRPLQSYGFTRPRPQFQTHSNSVATPSVHTKTATTPRIDQVTLSVSDNTNQQLTPDGAGSTPTSVAHTASTSVPITTTTAPAASSDGDQDFIPSTITKQTLANATPAEHIGKNQDSESGASPAATTSSAPQAQTVSAAPVGAPAARIDAIKKVVNEKVGNPVNLIDANNEIGREYMNALLDAMKKSNNGTPANDMERAMSRLEAAFANVETMLAEQGATPVATESTTTPATSDDTTITSVTTNKTAEIPPTPTVTPEAPAAEPATAPDQASVVDQTGSTEIDTTPTPAASPTSDGKRIAVQSVLEDADQALAATKEDTTAASPVANTSANTTPAEPVSPTLTSDSPSTPVTPLSSPPSTSGTTTAAAESTSPAATGNFTPVAKEKQLQQLLKDREQAVAAEQAELAEEIRTNPLMASDVDDGLRQLLSEWKLFKSSGLFGTGPSGIEHPLYQKIANLTMAAVLAGRFDGATPDIRKNINEYLSGWRYEEGITHEMGETFEHYLRRVIRHILDRKRD